MDYDKMKSPVKTHYRRRLIWRWIFWRKLDARRGAQLSSSLSSEYLLVLPAFTLGNRWRTWCCANWYLIDAGAWSESCLAQTLMVEGELIAEKREALSLAGQCLSLEFPYGFLGTAKLALILIRRQNSICLPPYVVMSSTTLMLIKCQVQNINFIYSSFLSLEFSLIITFIVSIACEMKAINMRIIRSHDPTDLKTSFGTINV